MRRKFKISIPLDVAARVQFDADRVCCVCRVVGKPIQIHHMDENPANNVERNLAVLCLDCHTDTQIRGGFHRKLDWNQVLLYRDNWNQVIDRKRAVHQARDLASPNESTGHLETLTTRLDALLAKKEYWMLAVQYHELGHFDLRDKYIELTVKECCDDETVIFLRSMQKRQDLIPTEVIEREIRRCGEQPNLTQLARLYYSIEDYTNAALHYSRAILESLDEGRLFTTAYYVKEFAETGLASQLFQIAYRKASDSGDLWLSVRALQELGWDDELASSLRTHREQILGCDNTDLKQMLHDIAGE